jgi:chromosomal replication initiation ATPase DnaA
MARLEDTLKYIKLYTGCDEHAIKRIRPILEKFSDDCKDTIVVKEKEIVEVVVQKLRPKGTIEKWAEKYFIENNTTYEKVNQFKRTTEVCRIRNLFCTSAYRAGYGYSEIGRYLKRDHTSILHNVKKIKSI